MKKLNEIFNTDIDIEIKDVKANTKEVNSGDLFVCVKGLNVDRHDLVNEAKEKGAVALVVDREVDCDLPQIKVENTNKELINILNRFYDYPSDKLTMIGVTGTDGKTSTATIINEFLNQINKCGYIGTNGASCPGYSEGTNNTTPASEDLIRIFNNFYNNKCNYVCMETSSEALAQGRCETFKYTYGIFTNLTREHLNFHKNMKNYLEAKAILFKQIKSDGYAIVNIDDEYGKKIAKYANCNILYYGADAKADVRFYDVKIRSNNTTFKVSYKGQEYLINSPLLGLFNVYNLTAALSVLLTMNVDINKLDFSKLFVDGRMFSVKLGQDFTVIVDYAHTPNGYLNLFSLVNTLESNKTIVVAGSAGLRDHEKRPLMGEILVKNADHVVFTSEDPRSEDPMDIINDLTRNIRDLSFKYEAIVDRKEAIYKAINMANKGDMVLILGKGNETYEDLKSGKVYFNDIEEAEGAIKQKIKS